MFLQLPPRFSPEHIAELQSLSLRLAARHPPGSRGTPPDWFDAPYNEELNQLLADNAMARVTIDTRPIRDLAGDKILEDTTYGSLVGAWERKPDVPVNPTRTTDFVFIRYIGHPDLQFNRSISG